MELGVRDIPVAVLCGGFGTRLGELGRHRPKPLVDVGGRPILWHVLRGYAACGFRRFVLCLGHRAADFDAMVPVLADLGAPGCEIELVDTGTRVGTGARLARAVAHLGAGTFAVAYGDGVGDVDFAAQLAFHRAHGVAATVVGVRARSPYGHLVGGGDYVEDFDEKPLLADTWISAGYFLFEPAVLDLLEPDPACVLETGPLRKLAAERELCVYRHSGYWHGMDTPADHVELDRRWHLGGAPWKTWD